MVYFIREEGTSNVKIGKADCPKSRLSSLGSGNHRKLSLELVLEGGFELENNLHKIFKDRKIRNEWFLFEEIVTSELIDSEIKCNKVIDIIRKKLNKEVDVEEKVRQSLESLMNNDKPLFITIKDIVEVSGLSKPTVHKAIGLFKEDINNYNTVKFQTNNYTEFVKLSNIGSIVGVIEKFIEEMEMKVTQRKVASRSRLHYNTVNNLWFEEEVQDVLDRYNKQKREFKKNKGCTT